MGIPAATWMRASHINVEPLQWRSCQHRLQRPRPWQLSTKVSIAVRQLRTAATLLPCTSIPASDSTCPRKSTFCWNKLHFLTWSFRLAARSLSSTSCKCCACVSKSREKTIISSNYTRQVEYVSPHSTKSIRL